MSVLAQKSIQSIVKQIRAELSKGNVNAKQANDLEKSRSYWRVGKLISTVYPESGYQSIYGKKLFKRLSDELEISVRMLYNTYQFYEYYPGESAPPKGLLWTHYRLLLSVPDSKQRQLLEKRALKEKLSTRELKLLIRKAKDNEIKTVSCLIPHKGRPYHYMIVDTEGDLYLDCGFKIYKALPENEKKHFGKESIVEVKKNSRYVYKESELNTMELYTYNASYHKAVDGDTFWFKVDAGFGLLLVRKVRLRGVNTPELLSDAGQKAKNFVENRLKKASSIVLKTYRRDLYDRYLVDVYYTRNEGEEVFLNKEILDLGLGEVFVM